MGQHGEVTGADDAAREVEVRSRRPLQHLRRGLVAGVVVAAALYLRSVAPWADVTEVLSEIAAPTVAVLACAALLNLSTYWLVMAAALPGLRIRHAAAAHLPATACSNLLPAGGALGTATSVSILRRLGYGGQEIATAMVVSGLWNTLAKLAVPVIAVGAAASSGELDAGAVLVAVAAGLSLVGAVHVVLRVLRHEPAARRAGAVAERALAAVLRRPERPGLPLAESAVRLQSRVADTVGDRAVRLTFTTAISHATLFAVFVLAVRAVGLGAEHITVIELLGIFALARTISLVPLTPGGVGILEVTLITALDATGGPPDQAVAAVVLYRGATFVLPTVLGAVAAGVWAVARRGAAAPGDGEVAIDTSIPVVVDLDGTLLPVTTRTLMAARLGWSDRAALRSYVGIHRSERLASKVFLWERAGLAVDRVPVRADLLRWLDGQHRLGRPLYLASGAPEPVVAAFARSYPIFAGGWGSDASRHLVGPAKAALLVEQFGPGGFDYVGDAVEDLPVWQAARHAVVCAPRRVVRGARRHARVTVTKTFPRTLGDSVFAVPRVLHASFRQRPRAAAAVSAEEGVALTEGSPAVEAR